MKGLAIKMTKNFVLFTGYLDRGRAESYHAKSRLENSLEQVVKNSNIDCVVVAFWNDDRLKDLVKYPDDNKKIFCISSPKSPSLFRSGRGRSYNYGIP